MNDTVAVRPQQPLPRTAADRSLRILHVLDHSLPLHSGYTFRTLAILRQQRRLGWQTFQLTSPKQGEVGEREEHVDDWTFYRTPPASGFGATLPIVQHRALMRALRHRLGEVVASVQPDILHAHSPVLNALPALAVGKASGVPVVYEVRAFWEDAAADLGTAREWGPRYRLTRALETHALRRADTVTTICEGLRKDILTRGIGADKVTVIPNAVDVTEFTFQRTPDTALMQAHGLTHGKTIGFAGSFYAYEGLDLLLRAMPTVVQAVPGARVLLLGGGPQEAALRTLAGDLGLDEYVHFVGRVAHAEVARYCSVMDVMVFPRISRRLTELVTPLKPLEAMAMGKLVAASNVGGHRELIADRETGYLFPPGSSDALARCLSELLAAPASWPAVIANARQFVERERTWAASVARYREVYARVLAGRQSTVEQAHGA